MTKAQYLTVLKKWENILKNDCRHFSNQIEDIGEILNDPALNDQELIIRISQIKEITKNSYERSTRLLNLIRTEFLMQNL